jgi:short-subunit dehydrogenase
LTEGLAQLRDRVAVVTGASSGIGAAAASALAREGARVVLVARRADRLRERAEAIVAAGGVAWVQICDVSRRDEVEAAAREIVARHGRVDLLLNCAGHAQHVLFRDHAVDDIESLIQTNTLGTIYWIKALLPQMEAREEGWIVNLSSLAGQIGQPDEGAYSAAKFAVTGLSQAIAPELAERGVHLLCVHPALVRTEMFTPEVLERMPPNTLSGFIEVDEFVRQMLRALARGENEVTLPRRYGWVPLLRAAFPRLIGRAIARVKLGPLREQ